MANPSKSFMHTPLARPQPAPTAARGLHPRPAHRQAFYLQHGSGAA